MIKWILAVLLMGLYANAFALIDFYGYKSYRPAKDSVDRYAQQLLGSTELEISEITVNPRGVYLDITEDAWISSDVNKLNIGGLTGDYLFKGSIPVPKNAVVTGLQTWRGDKLYHALLRESRYIVDTRYDDSVSLNTSLDSRIALLQQHTETHFEITLCRVQLGERIHVRIRYLLRPEMNGIGEYTVPVLFHTEHGSRPAFIQCTITANDSDKKILLENSTGTILINDTTTKLIQYVKTFNLKHLRQRNAALNLTEFTSGPYTGNYAAVNTGVTDSIITQLSKPIVTVFIWRWNNPEPFTTLTGGYRGLSEYSKTIIEQAAVLRETITALHRLGNSCALIHSVEGSSELAFNSPKINSRTDSSAISYLASMNEMELYERYKNEKVSDPVWVVKENGSESVIQGERDELVKVFTDAQRMLVDEGAGMFRHIVLFSLGGTSDRNQKNLRDLLPLERDSITVAAKNALWLGVDCSGTFSSDNQFTWSNFPFPAFSPVMVELTLQNESQSYSFPLNKQDWAHSVTFTARTSAAWKPVLNWTGIDARGEATRTISMEPLVFRNHADSGLAKVWAGDRSHIAEKEEIYPGGTFGILTKHTFLQATIENLALKESETVPFLSDEEILAPKTALRQPVAKVARSLPLLKIINNDLRIETAEMLTSLKVFDAKGRLILHVNPADYRLTTGIYTIPLSRLLKGRALNLLIIQVYGRGFASTHKMINGRIK